MKAILHNTQGNQPWLEISPEDAAEALAIRYLYDGYTPEEICKRIIFNYQQPELSDKPTD